MITKKTLQIEVELSEAELKEIVIKHISENNEDFKKTHSPENKFGVRFMVGPTTTCIASTTKVK